MLVIRRGATLGSESMVEFRYAPVVISARAAVAGCQQKSSVSRRILPSMLGIFSAAVVQHFAIMR